MKWISLEDKLPDHDECVLVTTSLAMIFIAMFQNTDKLIKESEEKGRLLKEINELNRPYYFCSIEIPGNCFKHVTHWMKLPKIAQDILEK